MYGRVDSHCSVDLAAVHLVGLAAEKSQIGGCFHQSFNVPHEGVFCFLCCVCVCVCSSTRFPSLPGGAGVFGRINIAALV